MKKVIRLTGNDVKNLIREAVQELSYQTLINASDKGLDTKGVEEALKDIEEQLNYSASGYKKPEANKYYQAALNGVKAIRTYFQRKQNQNAYFNDVYDSARGMRNNEDDYEDNRPITQAEYQDADDFRAKMEFRDAVNTELRKAVQRNGGWFYPDGVMPRIYNNWNGRVTDKLEISVYQDYYDKMAPAVKEAMSKFGYEYYDEENNRVITLMKFSKVKQQ